MTLHEINNNASKVQSAQKQEVIVNTKKLAEHQKIAPQDVLLVTEEYTNPLEKTKREKTTEKPSLLPSTGNTQKGAQAIVSSSENWSGEDQQSVSLISLIATFFRMSAQSQSNSFNAMYGIGNSQIEMLVTMTPLMQSAISNQFEQQANTCINDAAKAEVQAGFGLGGFALGTGVGAYLHWKEGVESDENIVGQKEQTIDADCDKVDQEIRQTQQAKTNAEAQPNNTEAVDKLNTKLASLQDTKLKLEAQKQNFADRTALEHRITAKKQEIADKQKVSEDTTAENAQLKAQQVEHAELNEKIKANEARLETSNPSTWEKVKRGYKKMAGFTKAMKKISETSQWITPAAQGFGQAFAAKQDRQKADALRLQGSYTAMSEGLKMNAQTLQQCLQRSEAGAGQNGQSVDSFLQNEFQCLQFIVSATARN